MNTLLLLVITLAFGISYLAIPQIIKIATKYNLVDNPGGRKQHKAPTPSLGGIAIFGGFWAAILLSTFITGLSSGILPTLIASSILFLVGLKDDLSEIKAITKLAVQLGVSSLLYFFDICRFDNLYGLLGFYEIHPIAGFIISILTTTLIINAYNLIDGINGLTGSLTFLSSVTFGAFFLQNGIFIWALASFAIAASTLGFLKYNSAKASIFMGDNGSTFIGLLFSVLLFQMLQADYPATSMFSVALSLISIPVFDLIRVFLYRISQKEGHLAQIVLTFITLC